MQTGSLAGRFRARSHRELATLRCLTFGEGKVPDVGGVKDIGLISPLSRNQRDPTGDDTPRHVAASSLTCPSDISPELPAIMIFRHCRSSYGPHTRTDI